MQTAMLRTAVMLLIAFPAAHRTHAEIVDRIVAVVEPAMVGGPPAAGQVITWSAAYEQACYEAFQKGDPPPHWSPAQASDSPELRAVLARMVDDILLGQALSRSPFAPLSEDSSSGRLQQIRDKYPAAEEFRKELERYHLTEAVLARRLARESLLLAFVESTLRPDVHIAPEQVESYYQSQFLPQLESRGRGAGPSANVPPLEDVRAQIQEILTQQEINRRLEEWLQQLRRAARIELRLD